MARVVQLLPCCFGAVGLYRYEIAVKLTNSSSSSNSSSKQRRDRPCSRGNSSKTRSRIEFYKRDQPGYRIRP